MWTPLRNQRGQAMIAMGIGFAAFIGLAALAVDVAHMAFTASEVQTVADAAATAAAATTSVADGQFVAGQNKIAGDVAPTTCGGASSTCIEFGNWAPDPLNPTQSIFTAGASPINAARATVTKADVPNIIAGIFGQATSTVTKSAVAAIRPTLPFALGSCWFTQPCNSGEVVRIHLGDPSTHSNDVGWANFYTNGTTDQNSLFAFMPARCQDQSDNFGGGGAMPILQTGSSAFNILQKYNGNGRLEFTLANCVGLSPPLNTFVIPFFTCLGGSSATSISAVVGFGTIKIDDFANDPLDAASDPYIDIELACGGANQVALVQ